MELRQLRYLAAVVEEANFTRASEKLFVTQSALSQQIQALEQDIGTTLLDRSKRGIRLTEAGKILYQHTQKIFLELEQAAVAIRELEGLQRGDLRIGVVQTVNHYLLPSLLTTFTQQHPHIRLAVDELSSDEIENRLEMGALQIGLGFVPASNGKIQAENLFEERLVLIVRRDHPLVSSPRIAVELLDQMPLVMLSNTFCTRRLCEESAQLAAAQPKIVMEMNTVGSILAVVEKTGLATVLPHLALQDAPLHNLISIDLYNPIPSRQVGVLWNRENYLCAASQAFIAVAKAHIVS